MRFCQSHWDRLRHEIEAAGMEGMVASSGREAAQRYINGMGDPLMDAHNLIVSKTMELLADNGLSPMLLYGAGPKGEEHVCPLCLISSCQDPACPNGCASRDEEFIQRGVAAVKKAWTAAT